MFANIINTFSHFTVADLVDILLVTFIIYYILLFIKDTKAYQMAIGFSIVGLLFLVTKWGNLIVSNSLIRNFAPWAIIAIIILFQGEIRIFLTTIGSRSLRKPLFMKSFTEKLENVFLAVNFLSSKKIGALIVIEKEISLNSYIDRGTKIDGELSKDLLVNIFFPNSPLHDGAAIIQGNKISAAGCLLPLPARHKLGDAYVARTRHLAAIGLSQETDAAVIVVSEQTGTISLATKGELKRGLDKVQLKDSLLKYLQRR
ncbi:MAG: TIGR00159 family protein [Candidatus Aminicenantes bacterium]|nr:MAG: TIGR00159 family protein [Candidatus Aminicenantes bacterium]